MRLDQGRKAFVSSLPAVAMELHPAGLVVARTPPGNDAVSFPAIPDKYPSARFDCMSKFPISQRLHWRGLVMAISFALPTFAQRKDTRDLGIVQQRGLLGVAEALDESTSPARSCRHCSLNSTSYSPSKTMRVSSSCDECEVADLRLEGLSQSPLSCASLSSRRLLPSRPFLLRA